MPDKSLPNNSWVPAPVDPNVDVGASKSVLNLSSSQLAHASERLPHDMLDQLAEEGSGGAMALPYDVIKTPGLPYRTETVPLSIGNAIQTQLSIAAGGQTVVLAALVTLLYRYTQQATISLGLIQLDGTTRELSITAAVDQTGRALINQIECQLQKSAPWFNSYGSREPPQIAVLLESNSAAEQSTAIGNHTPDLCLLISVLLANSTLTYNTNLFYPDTITRLIGHLNVLAEALLKDPVCPLSKLPRSTAEETHQLLTEWQPPRRTWPPCPLFKAITQHAMERPDAIALSFKDQTLTYGELEKRSNRLAHYLLAQGVRAGVRVAVCVEPSFDIVVCLLGIFKAGGAHVPLEPMYPPDRQAVILEDTRPRIVLTQSHLRPQLPPTSTPLLDMDSCFGSGLTREGGPLDLYSSTTPNVDVNLGDVAFVVYTSGTTGKPKGVMLTHGNLVNYILVALERYGFNRSHVQPAMARFSFSITMFELLTPLVAGGRVIILERDHVLDFERLVGTLEGSTVLHASPSLLRKLVAYVRDEKIDLSRLDQLQHVSSGGDIVSADLLEILKTTFRRAELFVIYGCSEIACMGCSYEVPRDQTVTRSLVGKPFRNVSIRLFDANQNLVPIGIAGEIYFSGAGVAQGYLNQPELTQEKFVYIEGKRFYRTGDIGRFDCIGNLEMLGRSDFQIKLRGIRIELGEIEVTLRQAQGVREGIVAARELNGEKTLIAYVVLDAFSNPDVKKIRRFLLTKLPDYMVPAVFVVLDALPVNINQKVDRKALPMPTDQDLARMRTHVPPRNELERQLVEIWQEVLKTESVGVEDNFFDIGGDSLMSVPLMIKVERTLGQTLPLSTLLTEPTIAGLAQVLQETSQERPCAVLLMKGGNQSPIFFIHDGEGEVLPYRVLATKLGGERPIYGIQPYSRVAYPMLHSRLADVVDYYTEQILSIQPHGPYLLSGLCIGGFIAFEIADRLKKMGHVVGMVALIDVAHVHAVPRSLAAQRLNRFSDAMKERNRRSKRDRVLFVLREGPRRIRNIAVFETRSRLRKAVNKAKMQLFRTCLDHDWKLPKILAHIPVRVVLRFAEKEYVVREPYDGEVLLFRATQRSTVFDGTEIDDTPYIDLFKDPNLGWEGKTTKGFRLFDVPAGHSSMLQEPNVDMIANAIQSYIGAAQQEVHVSHHVAELESAAPVLGKSFSSGDCALGAGQATSIGGVANFVDGCSLVVIIVNYGTAQLAIDCVRSLKAEVEARSSTGVVVVNNASPDGSGKLIAEAIVREEFENRVLYLPSSKNGGFAYGNNLVIRPALNSARPPSYFLLLNPDTVVRSGALSALTCFMDAHPNVGIAGSALENPDGSVWGTTFRFPTVLSELDEGMRLGIVSKMLKNWAVVRKMGDVPERVDWLPGASMMIRREVFEAIGLMDEDYFLYYEETDFCLRAQRAGWQCWYVPSSHVMHIAGQSTGVTARNTAPIRRPQYVFDSRRRYFVKNHGWQYAIGTDLAWLLGLTSWRIRRAIQHKPDFDPPQLLVDSIKNSMFLRLRN